MDFIFLFLIIRLKIIHKNHMSTAMVYCIHFLLSLPVGFFFYGNVCYKVMYIEK